MTSGCIARYRAEVVKMVRRSAWEVACELLGLAGHLRLRTRFPEDAEECGRVCRLRWELARASVAPARVILPPTPFRTPRLPDRHLGYTTQWPRCRPCSSPLRSPGPIGRRKPVSVVCSFALPLIFPRPALRSSAAALGLSACDSKKPRGSRVGSLSPRGDSVFHHRWRLR